MAIEALSAPRRSGRWLSVVALVLGGLLFLGQYLALAVMHGLRLVGSPTMPIATLDFAYLYPLGLFFSNPLVFWVSSVLVLGLAVLAWMWGHPGRVARVALLLVMLAVVATPLVRHYRPAVQAQSSVTLRVLTLPTLWESPSKGFSVGAEVCRCAYALRGWDDDGNLYYTETCGQRVSEWRYSPASDTRTRLSASLPDDMYRQTVGRPVGYVMASIPGDPQLRLSVREPVLRSPDGAWDAFIAKHVYGPEDVVVVAAGAGFVKD
jgi:hypothetical protein